MLLAIRLQTCGTNIVEEFILSPVLPRDLVLEIELSDAIQGVAAVATLHEQLCFRPFDRSCCRNRVMMTGSVLVM